MIRIFHNYDIDGYAAAAVLVNHYMTYASYFNGYSLRRKDIKTYSCEQGYIFDFSEINPITDIIYIVNCEFTNKDNIQKLIDLHNETKNYNNPISWIDNQKVSQDIINKYPEMEEISVNEEDSFVLPYNVCSVVTLAWIYCKQIIRKGKVQSKVLEDVINHLDNLTDYYDMPLWIHLLDISNRSIDNHKDFISAKKFTFGALNMNGGLNEVFLSKNCPFITNKYIDEYTQKLIDYGSNIIAKFQSELNKCIIMESAFQVYMENNWSGTSTNVKLNILAINTKCSKKIFEEEMKKFDAIILFNYDGTIWNYSIFSHKSKPYSVNNIAKYYFNKFNTTSSGNDHNAWWTAPCNIFEAEFTEHIQYKDIKW